MRCAATLLGICAGAVSLAACREPVLPAAGAAIAACPRDARPDDGGRCVCDPGDVPLLGGCVPAPVADGYCGPVAKATVSGACVFAVCTLDEAVDVDAGCMPLLALRNGPSSCGPGWSLVAEDRRRVCVPVDAACPRGTRAQGAVCAHAHGCPPGSLPDASACRPVVLRGGAHGGPLVDLAAWSALVLGVDGGPASADLCRPLEAHPLALGWAPGGETTLRLRIALSAPDDDLTRLSAEVNTRASTRGPAASGGSPSVPLPVAALADRAVASLLEPLRGLGGEATTPRVDVEVTCHVGGNGGANQ